jgi:Protein of unknown function (DUF2652)
MENRGLLFIPDISGFSRFVNTVELEHSRFIIQQLLDVLLRANDSGLQISEIEGDAILFYQFGEPVALRALYTQVEKMFRAFHQYLVAYDYQKICQCKACISAVDLTLKVITHYGEFTPLRVQHFDKLFGKDVIVAHQLLKNDIPQHEYWLVTQDLHRQPAELTQWMEWQESAKETERGEIRFSYTQLGPLKMDIPQPSLPQELAKKTKMLSVSRAYEPMVLVSYIPYSYISHLQTKLGHREGHEARRIGLEAMPLHQHIEGGHGERQARLKIRPAPMHHLFQMADQRQHGEDRLHEHPVLPLPPLTQFEIGRIALGSMEAGITQDDHAAVDLPNQPLKRVICDIGRATVPPHHQAILVQQQTEFTPDNPAMVGQAFPANLLRAAAFAHGVEQLDPIGVDDAQDRRSG